MGLQENALKKTQCNSARVSVPHHQINPGYGANLRETKTNCYLPDGLVSDQIGSYFNKYLKKLVMNLLLFMGSCIVGVKMATRCWGIKQIAWASIPWLLKTCIELITACIFNRMQEGNVFTGVCPSTPRGYTLTKVGSPWPR